MTNKKIIINADDLGRSPEINNAILSSFQKGLITDMSVMVTCENGIDDLKKKLAHSVDCLDAVGCHLCLTLGNPLTDEMKGLKWVDNEGQYIDVFRVPKSIFFNKRERDIIYKEFEAQLLYVRNTLNLTVNHLDSHQHIHFGLDLLPIVVKLCKKENIHYLRIPSCNKGLSIKSRIATRLKIIYIKLHGIKTVDFFGSPLQIMSFADESKKLVEAMVHPMFNSKGEIVNKVRIHKPDDCELLEKQVENLSYFTKEKFSSLV